jgi:polysaccharide export outer membrane protein
MGQACHQGNMRRVSHLRRTGLAICLAPALLLAGCATTRPIGGDPELGVVSGDLPPPEAVDVTADAAEYFIGPFDKLVIDVYDVASLSNREVQVDALGAINFPLIGSITINGMSPKQAELAIAEALSVTYLRNPQVFVNVKETVSRVVTIGGQVMRPGVFPVVGRMTLLKAMAVAGGTGEFANLSDVVVFRAVGRKRYAALYDFKAIQRGAYADPQIYPGDTVMVGDSKSRRLFKDIITVTPLLTPLILVLGRGR